jgi:hypothetical protein
MPAAHCPACKISYPLHEEYEFCLACATATVVRAKTPHKDFKTRAFNAYYDLRDLSKAAAKL